MSRSLKLARRELVRLGCEVLMRSERKMKFQLSRSEWVCTSDTPLHIVRSVVEAERRAQSAQSGTYIDRYPLAHTWDRLDDGDFYVTKHCKTRIVEMREQGLAASEVVAAVINPESVRTHGGKLLYCAGRVGVVIGSRVNGKYPLVTVLWSTDELWAQNPRPETEHV